MKRTAQRASLITVGVAALALTALASGCTRPPVTYVVEGMPPAMRVTGPPPAPRIETPTEAPGPGYIWRDGYWNWNDDNDRYVWVGGEWVQPPAPDYVFVAGAYALVGGDWQYRPGFWCPRRYRQRYWRRHRRRWRSTRARRVARGTMPRTRKRRPAPGSAVAKAPPAKGSPSAPSKPDSVRSKAPPATGIEQNTGRDRVDPRAVDRATGRRAPRVTPPRRTGPQRIAARRDARVRRVGPRPNRTVVLEHSGGGSRAVDIHNHRSVRRYDTRRWRKNPTYRGKRDGRPAFGDDPAGRRRYQRDPSGAIVLAPGSRRGVRRRRGGTVSRIDPQVRNGRKPRFVRGPRTGTRRAAQPRRDARANWRSVRAQPRTYYPSRPRTRTYVPRRSARAARRSATRTYTRRATPGRRIATRRTYPSRRTARRSYTPRRTVRRSVTRRSRSVRRSSRRSVSRRSVSRRSSSRRSSGRSSRGRRR